jgi:hypothetical protein
MKKTVGTPDRALRVVLAAGAVAGAGAVGFTSAGGIVLLAAATIMLLTAATSMCPLYSLLRVSTRRRGVGDAARPGPGHQRAA